MSRERMNYDVVIVGAGPAGLAAAIRLKQQTPSLSVVVIEKAGAIGGHVISGAVMDPAALDELVPEWRSASGEAEIPVTDDRFFYLSAKKAWPLPALFMPRLMSNHGNFVVSLANICRWLAAHAEALGVEIYPGFAAAELVFDAEGAVIGVATGDVGLDREGRPGESHQPGMELVGCYTVLAEGVRGNLSKQAIARFALAEGAETPKYGIGFKEVWQVEPAQHRPGHIQHSFGWPLPDSTGGGSFLYHGKDNQVTVGFVVHLDYRNPYLSPFEEFQRFKSHPAIRRLLINGTRIAYGARAISEGGFQSVPKLAFPGGVLVGDAAGFVNVPRIKGSHNAVRSGMLVADHLAAALGAGRAADTLLSYDAAWRQSAIGADLYPVRNVKPLWSRFGTLAGIALGGLDMWAHQLFGRSLLGTLRHASADHEALEPAARHRPIAYPAPDGNLTFDRLSSIFLSGVNHREDQPVHLVVADAERQRRNEHDVFGGPSSRYCPAGVYEWIEQPAGPHLQINAQNCIHCKTCDIKDPEQNITWTPPEGGGGPNYANM
ncbi:MAG: electron transfer flavoprotein-ubiquinone oxidoreductase [Devosia sp.]|nr:electron transfer flavoprotein-ubiquinone oxidoreductase [Devosia sp.]